MEHQFGLLHRGGTSVDLCPSLEVMVMVILQGILVQEVHWAKSSTVQSPEEKINLSWTPISLGALLPHPVRPMPQGLVLEGHGAQQGNGRRRPPSWSRMSLTSVRLAPAHTAWGKSFSAIDPTRALPVRGPTGLHLPASAPAAPPPPSTWGSSLQHPVRLGLAQPPGLS